MELRWDLSIIYDSIESKELKKDLSRAKQLIHDTTVRYESLLSDNHTDAERILFYIQTMNELNSLLLKLSSYARLKESIDENKSPAKELQSEISQILPSLNQINIPFLRYLSTLDHLEDILEEDPTLKEHAYIIMDLQEQSRHLLSKEQELLIGEMQETGSYAFEKLNNDLLQSLNVEVHIGGETKNIPLSVVRNLAYAQSQEVRKAAYKGELSAYRKIASTSAACLNAIKGEALTIAHVRHFSSPLDMTLTDSRMTKKTLDAMFTCIVDARPHFHNYLRKKSKLLGHDGPLPFYDLYAPMGHFDLHFTYEQARDFIIETFREFSDDLADYAQGAFDNGWIDMEPRDFKNSGAFCCNIHAMKQSRIFINFRGTYYDLTLLAHEIGHGYHYDKLNQQSILNTDYTMPLAETASIFCQTLIINKLLKISSPETRFAILENELLNYTQMLIEILARYTFETKVFEKRMVGPLYVKDFNQLLLEAQKFAYGDGMSEEKHPYMWICKPHYYFPDFHFYNFPYPFALLFSKGLYAIYQQEGASFIPKFEKLLAATGCNSVENVFRLIGLESTDKNFYNNGMELILEQIREFEQFD